MFSHFEKWLFGSFIKKNSKNEYFFDSIELSKLAGEPVDHDQAKKGEQEILNDFLHKQIQLM